MRRSQYYQLPTLVLLLLDAGLLFVCSCAELANHLHLALLLLLLRLLLLPLNWLTSFFLLPLAIYTNTQATTDKRQANDKGPAKRRRPSVISQLVSQMLVIDDEAT